MADTARELMTNGCECVGESESIQDAAAKLAELNVGAMEDNQVRRLPVLEDKRLVGIVSQADVARKLSEQKTGAVVEAISAEG